MEIKNSLPPQVYRRMAGAESTTDPADTAGSFSAQLNTEMNAVNGTTNTNSIQSPEALDGFIRSASQKYGIDEKVLKAVIKAESSFDANATSSAGAMGLMQLMPATAKGLGVTDPYDPEQSINGGAKYLSYQLKRFDNNLELALAAYNAGPNAVLKYGGVPPYKETENYVKKIMGWINE